MRSQVPDGDLGAIIEAAVTEKLARLEARRFATTSRPRKDLSKTDTAPASRHIPAAVRRAVRERDGNYGQEAIRRFSRSATRLHGTVALASAGMTASPMRPPPPGT